MACSLLISRRLQRGAQALKLHDFGSESLFALGGMRREPLNLCSLVPNRALQVNLLLTLSLSK